MKAKLITAPTAEPVSVQEAKEHLRVETSADDELILGLTVAARTHVENVTRRALLTQTWEYYLDRFPSCDYIELPFGNLASVTSVKYKDSAGTETTMAVTTEYIVETNGDQHGRVVLPYGVAWPSPSTYYPSNPIIVRFVCGWTSAENVPQRIRLAIKMLIAEMYENRGESVLGQTVSRNQVVDLLLASDRLWGEF